MSSLPFFAAHGAALLIVGTAIAMVAVHVSLLVLAGERTPSVPLAARRRVSWAVGGVLVGWLAWALLAVPVSVVAPEPTPEAGRAVQRPELLLAMGAFVAAGASALFVSKSLRALNAAMPPTWLVAVQVYRVAGLLFLWPYLAYGAVSSQFALPAGIGDALTGIMAPFVAWAVAQRRPGAHRLAVAWNWFGILDLVVAPVAAVVAQSTNIGRFPLVVIPLFLGPPLGILTHLYSLRNLKAQREAGWFKTSTASGAS